MQRSRHFAFMLLIASVPTHLAAQTPPLDGDQQALLGRLSPEAAAGIAKLATEAGKVRAEITALANELKEQRDGLLTYLAEIRDGKSRSEKLRGFVLQWVETTPPVREFLGVKEDLVRKAQEVEARLKKVQEDVERLKMAAKEELRQAEAELRRELLAFVQPLQPYLDLLEKARNPAQYARDFLENQIRQTYLNRPFTFGEIKFTIVPQDFKAPLFSADAKLALMLDYPAAGVQLKAAGLYFKYKAGAAPEPVLDKVKIDTNALDVLKGKALKSLGDVLPADIGLPIQVKEPSFHGFDDPDPKKRGSLSLKVQLGFGDLLGAAGDSVKAEAKVAIHLDGKVELDGSLKGESRQQVPIGQGLILDGYSLEVKPKDPKEAVTIGTWIATAAGGRESLALDVKVSFGFPITRSGVKFAGKMLFARNVTVGEVNGLISKEKIAGELLMPGKDSPLPKNLFEAGFKFELNPKGFLAKGMASLFSLTRTQMELDLRFNGHGSLKARESLKILGQSVNSTLDVSFEPGFKNLKLLATLSVDIDVQIRKLNAVVEIDAARDRRPMVKVDAQAVGVTVHLEMNDLSELPILLPRAFLEKLGDILDNFADALADLEKVSSRALAKAEEKYRKDLSAAFARVGLDRLSTGNKELDARLGELSKGGKNVVAWGVRSRERAGKWLTEMRQNPGGTLVGAVESLGRDLSNLENAIGNIFDPSRRRREQERRDRVRAERAKAEQRLRDQQAREKEVDAQLARLVAAINGGQADITVDPEQHVAVGGKAAPVASLRIRCENAVADAPLTAGVEPKDLKDGVLVLLFTARGYRVTPGTRVSASSVNSAVIRFLGMTDDKKRTLARIEVPEFKHGSGLPARPMLRSRLADLVEKLVPACDIEGRHYEKLIALENKTDEPLRVWVQPQTRLVEGVKAEWAWLPGDPKRSSQAASWLLKPGENKLLRWNEQEGSVVPPSVSLGEIVRGARVRLWAESESGRTWTRYHDKDLWLVPEDDGDGRRHYEADKIDTYHYGLSSSDGPRLFKERQVKVKNATPWPVLVSASATSARPGGGEATHNVDKVEVAPGKTLTLRREDGWVLRGHDVRVWASDLKDERLRWWVHRTRARPQTDAHGYKAKDLGTGLWVLEPPTGKGDSSRTSLNAPVVEFPYVADHVRVPDLEGLSFPNAAIRLQRMGLEPPENQSKKPLDVVLGQLPRAGDWAAVGSTVKLSRGIRVPDVGKMLLGKAARELVDADLRPLLLKTPGYGPTFKFSKDDLVVAQFPGPDTAAKRSILPADGGVKLRIHVAVPDVRGKTFAEAQALLATRNLKGAAAKGTPVDAPIYTSRPFAKAHLEQGSTVALVPKTRVPDLSGKPVDGARVELARLGLKANLLATAREGDRVVSQSPGERAWADPGSAVKLSPGPDLPDLLGKEADSAFSVLGRLDMRYRIEATISRESDDSQRIGKSYVVKQSHRGLTPRGTLVVFTLARFVDAKIAVPGVVGREKDFAEAVLRKAGLTPVADGIRILKTEDSSRDGKVVVLEQSPGAGSKVARGSKIALLLGRYQYSDPDLVVPNFVERLREDAENLARKVGLEPRITIRLVVTRDRALIGRQIVYDQSIPAGRKVPPGTSILLRVNQYRFEDSPPPPPPGMGGNILGDWSATGPNMPQAYFTFERGGGLKVGVRNPRKVVEWQRGSYTFRESFLSMRIKGTLEGRVSFDGPDLFVLTNRQGQTITFRRTVNR